MISDGQPNPFAFRILYPSLCGSLFCFFCSAFPSFIAVRFIYVFCLVHTHPWPHLKTINFMWLFLYRAQSCSTTFSTCVLYTILLYYLFLYCLLRRKLKYTHSTTQPSLRLVDDCFSSSFFHITLLPGMYVCSLFPCVIIDFRLNPSK